MHEHNQVQIFVDLLIGFILINHTKHQLQESRIIFQKKLKNCPKHDSRLSMFGDLSKRFTRILWVLLMQTLFPTVIWLPFHLSIQIEMEKPMLSNQIRHTNGIIFMVKLQKSHYLSNALIRKLMEELGEFLIQLLPIQHMKMSTQEKVLRFEHWSFMRMSQQNDLTAMKGDSPTNDSFFGLVLYFYILLLSNQYFHILQTSISNHIIWLPIPQPVPPSV